MWMQEKSNRASWVNALLNVSVHFPNDINEDIFIVNTRPNLNKLNNLINRGNTVFK
jgi:hypothetical protein